MRPFDEIPFEESDYSDVALMVASVREWPAEDFAAELDARVARRFAEAPTPARRGARVRLPRWAAGPAAALVAGAVATVVVLSGGGVQPTPVGKPLPFQPIRSSAAPSHSADTPQAESGAGQAGSGALSGATINATASAPVAPGAKQIQSAQISLTTANGHVDQVAQEVFDVVGSEHGTVQSSQITAASRGSGGGYASFSLSVPTGNLETTLTELSRLRFAAVQSRTDSSQNVSHRYDLDQRELADALALRTSLLRQLQSATTQTSIDSLNAQLKLAEQQITSRQTALSSLAHQISYSNIEVYINQNGLPFVPPVIRPQAGGFTIAHALNDAVHVLVVSAGVALIALAVLVPVGLLAALLMWLWVGLRQRRREHALDGGS
jgi:hypothetical protein